MEGATVPHFEELVGVAPYPWQARLYTELLHGRVPEALPLPTGLGKTSAVLLYLLALAHGAPLPVRLAYVVDRRTIVDQTAEVVRRWVERLATLRALADPLTGRAALPTGAAPVTVGVLRGGLADTGEWRLDPARPAVVIGTVDMLGSRLLFSGYGDGRSRRSLHAGLLGCDTAVFLDESHLSPAMGALLRIVAELQTPGWRPPFRVMTMSATPERAGAGFHDDADLADARFRQRLHASKTCILHEVERNRRDRMVELAMRFTTGSVLIYCREVKEARALQRALVKALGKGEEHRVALLTGTIRGFERRALAETDAWRRFLPGRDRSLSEPSAFLVSTSAGEVGVDLDADHAVMDLAPMESMIQRFGRVNRAGINPDTQVHVVFAEGDVAPPKKDDPATFTWKERLAVTCRATRDLLAASPDVSPATLLGFDPEARLAASSPAPTIAPLTRDRVELLAATSAQLPRANIDLFLRGISDDWDAPGLQLLWRSDVPQLLRAGDAVARDVLGLFPPLPDELMQVPASKPTLAELATIVERTGNLRCVLRDARGQVSGLELRDTVQLEDLYRQRRLNFATLVLDAKAGGLSTDGLLDGNAADEVIDHADTDERLRYRETESGADRPLPPWARKAVRLRIPLHDPDDEEADRSWWVYARAKLGEATLNAESDASRLAALRQTVSEHDEAVGRAAGRLARALALPVEIASAVEAAGAWHDEGKRRTLWQRAAGNRGEPMAKPTSGVLRGRLLDGFRHEFASLVDADRTLPNIEGADPARDLTLHLIAAHHGFARPGFTDPRQWDRDLPVVAGARIADEVEQRYARLQAAYGPWTLAWLEALVKSADAWVSAGNAVEEA